MTGNTYEHRQALRRAGFRWDADEKRYEGTPQAVASLDVPRSWDVASALGVRTKGKIGGGRVVR